MESKFPVWKIIKIGTGLKTADDFRKDIIDREMIISKRAINILKKSAVAIRETKLNLVKVTAAELGFKEWTRRDQIYAKGKE